MLKITDSIT